MNEEEEGRTGSAPFQVLDSWKRTILPERDWDRDSVRDGHRDRDVVSASGADR